MFNPTSIILIVIVVIAIITLQDRKEGYRPLVYRKRYCSACGHKSRKNCSTCANCGICYTPNGSADCTPGDRKGPYFRRDCTAWEYGRNYDPRSYGRYYFPKYYIRSGHAYFRRPRNRYRRSRWAKKHGTKSSK